MLRRRRRRKKWGGKEKKRKGYQIEKVWKVDFSLVHTMTGSLETEMVKYLNPPFSIWLCFSRLQNNAMSGKRVRTVPFLICWFGKYCDISRLSLYPYLLFSFSFCHLKIRERVSFYISRILFSQTESRLWQSIICVQSGGHNNQPRYSSFDCTSSSRPVPFFPLFFIRRQSVSSKSYLFYFQDISFDSFICFFAEQEK